MPLTRDALEPSGIRAETSLDAEPPAEMLEISADSAVPEAAKADGSDVAPALPAGSRPPSHGR